MWECDRCLGCGDGAIAKRCCKQFAFGDVGDAIAKRSVGIAFGMWGCDSEALRRNRCLGCEGCDRFLGCGDAIAVLEM